MTYLATLTAGTYMYTPHTSNLHIFENVQKKHLLRFTNKFVKYDIVISGLIYFIQYFW